MSKSKTASELKEISSVINDPKTGKTYIRGRFLGKGGFARCYELIDKATQISYAGKIVSKQQLIKQHQKEKMSQEIAIHRTVHHQHVVDFISHFEDEDNVYVILELCRKRSLMELHKRRKDITEPETRYFMRQICLGVKFLHNHRIIHRDLKLGNVFLNDDMDVKLGDFGLATKLDHNEDRKMTLCGTPNYIAPEILTKGGHSYEVDVWSIGCIMYTMLVGRPPFETETLRETYSRIRKNVYNIPYGVGQSARRLIRRILQHNPKLRPTIDEILNDEFITGGYLPTRLPVSCLSMAPRFDTISANNNVGLRRPLIEINKAAETVKTLVSNEKSSPSQSKPEAVPSENGFRHLYDLKRQVETLLKSAPSKRPDIQMDEAEDPAAVPFFWFSKWVDYSDKYGLGYQLSDDSIGIIFNDYSKLCLLANEENLHYVREDGTEHYYSMSDYPSELNKKVVLLKYFREYMREHLMKTGTSIQRREGDELSRLPILRSWFRSRSAIVLYLSNGTLQVNFFDDHSKLIMCPLMGAVTYIDEHKEAHTYRLTGLQEYGCTETLVRRLEYAVRMVDNMLVVCSKQQQKQQLTQQSVPTMPQTATVKRVYNAT